MIDPDLPPPRPALVAVFGEGALRWDCLRMVEELHDAKTVGALDLPAEELADLAGEFAELVVGGLNGDHRRAVLALARIEGRHGRLVLRAAERQAWLNTWAASLRRHHLPAEAAHPLWEWMAALTSRWLATGESTAAALPLDLYRRS